MTKVYTDPNGVQWAVPVTGPLAEAVREIDKLRAENAELRAWCLQTMSPACWAAMIDAAMNQAQTP